MRKTVLIYGALSASLIILLKVIEYQYFSLYLPVEIYVGIIAVIFTITGIWLGNHIMLWKQKKALLPATASHETVMPEINENAIRDLAISKREMEVLILMAKGCSNEEIAEKLFVSLNTIKKHSSSIFLKLDVKRRTQAVDKARTLGLLG